MKQNNYAIISEHDRLFHVIESQTNQTVNTYDTRKDANKFVKRANSGSYFAGWTPMFMLQKAKIGFKS